MLDLMEALVRTGGNPFSSVDAIRKFCGRDQATVGRDSDVGTKTAALFDETGHEAVEGTPRHRAARAAVHASDIGITRPERADVDADAAAAAHDLHHLR